MKISAKRKECLDELAAAIKIKEAQAELDKASAELEESEKAFKEHLALYDQQREVLIKRAVELRQVDKEAADQVIAFGAALDRARVSCETDISKASAYLSISSWINFQKDISKKCMLAVRGREQLDAVDDRIIPDFSSVIGTYSSGEGSSFEKDVIAAERKMMGV